MSNIIDKIRVSGTDYTLSATSSGGNPTVELTQAEYDALVSAGTVSADTYYIITDAQAGDLTQYWTSAQTQSAITQATSGKADSSAVTEEISAAVSGKQDTLVSGTNIKTINNESLLGSGNIDIQGGGKAIVAGTGIAITTGETADTVSLDINAKKGSNTTALVFNYTNANTATEAGATSFGYMCKATNQYTFANGNNTQAKGYYSHSEGESTIANGWGSHSDGQYTNANGKASHTEGSYVNADNDYESSQGRYNVSNKANTTWGDSGNTLFSVGNGASNSARHNAFEIRQNGDIYLSLNGQDVKLQDQLGGGGGITSGEVQTMIDESISGKTDESAFTAHTADTTIHVSSSEKNTWNNKSDFSGSYNDLTDKPTIPTSASQLTNDSGYITSGDAQTQIDNSISGKVDTSTFETYSGNVETALSGKQDTLSAGTGISIVDNVISATGGGGGGMSEDDELLLATALTDLNDRKADKSEVREVLKNYQGKGDYVTTSVLNTRLADYETALDEQNTEEVTSYALNDLNNRFGGLRLVKLTQSEYTALTDKDDNTLYVVVADPT